MRVSGGAFFGTPFTPKAERLLDEPLNLEGFLLASLDDEGDDRAMQAEIALKVVKNRKFAPSLRKYRKPFADPP